MPKNEASVTLKLLNEQFNSAMRTTKEESARLNKEFELQKQKMKLTATEAEQLSAKIEFLKSKQELAAKTTADTSAQYERVKGLLGENSNEAKKLANTVLEAQIAEQKLNNELQQTTSKLEQTKSAENELNSSVKKTTQSLDEQTKVARETADKLNKIGESAKNTGQNLSVGLTTPIVAVGVASAKMGIDFEAQLDRVGAISGATSEQLDALKESALSLGASTSKSATEIAIGQEALAAMGFTANEIIGAMPGIISAAEASGSDMAQTADVMAASLNIFGLEASEATRVADILAQTANISAADLTDMQYALKYAGPPAAALGVSLEELSASIGIMTNAGMQGEQAGTSLRSAMLGLLDPSEETSKLMSKMGVQITDAQGNFVGLANLVDNLSKSMEGQTETQKAATLSQLVGKEAVSGMLSLMAAGPSEINKMTKALKDSAGASSETAKKMKDNLKGTLEELGGTLETAAITVSEILAPSIESTALLVQGLVMKFQNLNPTVQTFLLVIIGLVAALGPMLIVGGVLASSIGSIIGLIGPLILAVSNAGGMVAFLTTKLALLGPVFTFLTGPIGLTIAAVIAIGVALVIAYQKVDWFRNGVNEIFEQIRQLTSQAFEAIKTTVTSLISSFVDFGKGTLDDFKAFWEENGQAIMAIVALYFGQIKANIEFVIGLIKVIFQVAWPIISGVVKIAFEMIQFTISNVLDIILGIIQVAMKLLQGDWKGAWNSIKELTINIWNNTERFLRNISLVQIGKNIIQGLIDGIDSMASSLLARARAIADAIKSTIQEALDIHSPSRVMRGFGINIGQGLVLGMDDMLDKVTQSAARLAESVEIGANSKQVGTSNYDYSKTFSPNVTIHTNDSGDKAMQRTLRRLAFQL